MFQIGQRVTVIIDGNTIENGTVISTTGTDDYPVLVRYDSAQVDSFTLDGRLFFNLEPCLFVDTTGSAEELLQEALGQLEFLNIGSTRDLIVRIKAFLDEA